MTKDTDCEKCWSSPCKCGWFFKNIRKEVMVDFILSTLKHKSITECKWIIKEINSKFEK